MENKDDIFLMLNIVRKEIKHKIYIEVLLQNKATVESAYKAADYAAWSYIEYICGDRETFKIVKDKLISMEREQLSLLKNG